MVDEIEHWLRSRCVRNFAFYDDALLVDSSERAVPMLEEIIRRDLGCTFHCPNGMHLREINFRVAPLLFKAGFRTIRFGFETASAARQATTGGKVTTDELREAVAYLREAGYGGTTSGSICSAAFRDRKPGKSRRGIDLVRRAGAKPIPSSCNSLE